MWLENLYEEAFVRDIREKGREEAEEAKGTKKRARL